MLESLLITLHKRHSSGLVFNQYSDMLILNNLRLYLTHLLKIRSEILMIGEAPGYRGCRLTGIPFTSSDIITTDKHELFKKIGRNLTYSQVVSENTATILWSFLGVNNSAPILWNAFPFHPHQSGKPESNRRPNVSEIREGEIYLKYIYDLFKPKKLCSLGRVGESVLKKLFPNKEITYVRHPSYGGKKDFIEGMKNVYVATSP